ncbi:MAG: HAMP domain-containing histidine kinase [Clostridia bacterium]|nr:HAMP domain-containing histidine kinase [Clostridia bacterium]
MIFFSSILKPIKEINETTKLIAQGNMDARIDHYLYDDEIGELSKSINHMAKEISAADKLKNDFISTVSHELRTPLTAIKGWGETILQVSETDPVLTKRGMNVIIDEATRLSGIVEELLDFSRIQSGRLTLKIEKMDILAELDETVFAFKDRATREGIDLIYNAPDLPAPMDGDPGRIKQVFVNIIDNALKYTNQGGKITVTAEIADDKIKITVEDTGCGISAEDIPHVKEKFYKANITVHGSGIGLAVSDEIVKMHNGTLDIYSVLGEGTTVVIGFDIDHVELGEDANLEAVIAAEQLSAQEDE